MDNALDSWALLNEALKTVDEKTCLALLTKEKKGQKRAQFVMRIYGRYTKLRSERERKELFN